MDTHGDCTPVPDLATENAALRTQVAELYTQLADAQAQLAALVGAPPDATTDLRARRA